MKGRVVFIVRLKPDVTDEQFLEAYEAVRYEVARASRATSSIRSASRTRTSASG